MGEVYRATDTKLGREVALKVLPEAFAQNAEHMARLQREAHVLASLNHPNVAALHGIEDGALVMEMVEGQTLAERLAKGPIPLDEALPIARQIAEAVEAAHDKNIVHRDLKPANVKITPEGTVKVLDFGLAKAAAETATTGNPSNSPTLTATQAGMIMGTAAYMAPEQARGQAVDKRADIWSFGVVLFEMLTERRAFHGETTTDILASLLRVDPDWNALPASTPPSVVRLLRRCLTKDRKQRLQAIGEARIVIDEILSGRDSAETASSSTGPAMIALPLQRAVWRRSLFWTAMAASVAAITLAFFLFRRPSAPIERMQFAIPIPSEINTMSLSADGRILAYVARDDSSGQKMLYVQRIGSPNASRLEGTEGASFPFWSPDNSYVAFFARGHLKKVAVAGGPPNAIAEATDGRGGAWGNRGVVIYAPDPLGPLWRVSADGTNASPLTANLMGHQITHRFPVFLPDGDHFLFLAGAFTSAIPKGDDGIYLSSLRAAEKKFMVACVSNPGYSDGHLFCLDDKQQLIETSMDSSRAAVTGEPRVLAAGVGYDGGINLASFAAGGHDTIVYTGTSAREASALTWYDRAGRELGQVGEPGILGNPSLSHDGTRVVFDAIDPKGLSTSLWIASLNRNTVSRFTFSDEEEVSGTWSRDGTQLAFYGDLSAGTELLTKNASGLQPEKSVFKIDQDEIIANSWSRDDQQILCTSHPSSGGSSLVLIDVKSGKKSPFIVARFSVTNGQISPDGKWVAYASNESGDWEIYVTTFPDPAGKWQVSRRGGTEPRWRGDGKEIFYLDPKGTLTAVEVTTDQGFSSGSPSPLFQLHARALFASNDLYSYDASPDGKRFLVNRYLKPDHVQPLTVVLNATAETKQ
jgi:eukaryotic-like serine/threonine-protein kinase